MSGTDHSHDLASRLNDWLDGLVADTPRDDTGIDPIAVATVERFFARDDAPPPPPDLADQVWDTIVRASTTAVTNDLGIPAVSHVDGNGRHPVARKAIPVSIWTQPTRPAAGTGRAVSGARRWGFGFAQASSLFLLVLMLGAGYFALVLGPDSEPNRGPVAVVPAPTHPAVDMADAETLFTLTLPAELLPQSPERGVTRSSFIVQPGTVGRWQGVSKTCCPGVRVDYVVAGAYTVTADGPINVRRADEREEVVPAGTEFVLGPGDRMIVPEGVGFDNANNGDVPVRVVGWYLYRGSGSRRTSPNWWNDTSWEWTTPLPAQPGAVTLRLTRVRLDPGVDVPAASGSVQFVVSLDESAKLGQQSDGSIRNVGKTDFTVFILTATAAPPEPGAASPVATDARTASLRSAPDAEAPLLSLTLTSDLFPPDVWESAVLVNATIPPHTQGAWPGMESRCCSGVRIDYVAQGNVTIRADGDVQVVWAGGRLEAIRAGRELALGPGDTLITPRDIPFVNANSGDEPVRLIGWILDAGEAWQTEVSNWRRNSSADPPPSEDFPIDPDAITLTLRQVEIPAGGDVPATPGALRFIASLDPATMLGERSDGTVRNVGSATATAYVLTMEPAESP